MTNLVLHGREVESFFELLGHEENDITFSLGWTLSRSPSLLRGLIRDVFPTIQLPSSINVLLQEWGKDGGFTDIELIGEGFHCIIEAKRGWTLPSDRQLRRYSHRFAQGGLKNALLVLSEASPEFAGQKLPRRINGIRVVYRDWQKIAAMTGAKTSHAGRAEKHLLRELHHYLGRVITMQDQESNWVYCVSLGSDTPSWSTFSWIDIVVKKRRYFHPYNYGGWPLKPPTYIGFRYHGRLQSIHHIDGYEIMPWSKMHHHIRGIARAPSEGQLHFLYHLGKPILPAREIRNGGIWPNGRIWATIDALLTAKTVKDAIKLSNRRNFPGSYYVSG